MMTEKQTRIKYLKELVDGNKAGGYINEFTQEEIDTMNELLKHPLVKKIYEQSYENGYQYGYNSACKDWA